MSITSKTTSLQAYNMVVYDTALHPEFFGIQKRKCISHGPYEVEAWIFTGGHVVRFEHIEGCVTEVVTEWPEKLPANGHVITMPCAGERDHEQEFDEAIQYVASMQTETLSDHLYLSTYNELLEHSAECDAVTTKWHDEIGRPNLSLLDMQRYNREVHVQGYHVRSDCSLVLRTQSIFQVND